jgi:hypothetical protein
MASSNKRKTTMAKLNRERKLLERRQEKQARKVARKQAAADAKATDEGYGPSQVASAPESPAPEPPPSQAT